jgi:hypothetical protein
VSASGRGFLPFFFLVLLLNTFLVMLIPSALVLGAAGAVAASDVLHRFLLSEEKATATGARCLDGSVAGGYYASGDPSKFVIFLQGGGLCFSTSGSNGTNCAYRAHTALGSSNYWAATMPGGNNVYSGDPAVNPFAGYTRVFVPYCSGDLHLGQRNGTVSPSFPFRFSGHLIIGAVIQEMLARFPGFETASEVLLSGSSAGGIGTFQNADFVAELLPRVKSFRAAPQVGARKYCCCTCSCFCVVCYSCGTALMLALQGGYFLPPVVNFTAWETGFRGPPYFGEYTPLPELYMGYLSPACVAAIGAGLCGTIQNAFPFFKTPMHVAENEMDSNQIFIQVRSNVPSPDCSTGIGMVRHASDAAGSGPQR